MIDPHNENAELRRCAARVAEWIVLGFWLTLIALVLFVLIGRVSAAPAPFPRTTNPRQPLCVSMRGEWVMHWSSTTWLVTLTADGGYTAASGSGGTVFVGSWRACQRERVLHVLESSTPHDARSWRAYSFPIDGGPLSGDYTGSARLERPAP